MRLFFAFLALLSGLAAVQAPAHAARHEQLAYDVQSPSPACSQHGNVAGEAVCGVERLPGEGIDEPAQMRLLRLGVAARPVLIGIDKALE